MSIAPYQFEPIKQEKEANSDSEWEDIEDVESDTELEGRIVTLNRSEGDPSRWCKCDMCETMPVNRECLCCAEIDEIKYKKLSDGKRSSLILFLK